MSRFDGGAALLLWLRACAVLLAAALALAFGPAASNRPAPAGAPAGNGPALAPSLLNAAAIQVSAEDAAAAAVGKMSRRQLAGQRVIYSYPGPKPPASLLALIRRGEVAGVMFFAGNYRSRSQFTAVVRELEAANASPANPVRAYPLLLMTDQEGGEVRRLPGAPALSQKQIGAIRPLAAAVAAAGRAGASAAANLAGYGLNVDLAPVLDVYRKPGDFDDRYQRSYSRSAALVSVLGTRFITAMQSARVAAAVKHFPGLGAAAAKQSTDVRPVTIYQSAAAMASTDEYPYTAAIGAGVRLVMLSWAMYPGLGSRRPAGLAAPIVQGLLRGKLGFEGVTITDAIGAGALRAYGPVQRRAVLAAGAGMDLILAASQSSAEGSRATDGLVRAYSSGALSHPSFRAAVEQILWLRQSLRP